MPKFSTEFEQELLSIGPFGGLDATSGGYYVDNGMATDLLNIVPDRKYQSYCTVQGRVYAGVTIPGTINGFTKFMRQGLPSVYVASAGFSPYLIYSYDPGFNIVTSRTFPTGITTLTPQQPMSFATYAQNNATNSGWLFMVNPVDQPLKMDANSLALTKWQAAPPTSAFFGYTIQAGNINSVAPYYYRCTFSSAALETSPGPILRPGIVLTNQQVTFSGLPVSTDAQITTTNLYRLGGASSTWLLVGSVANGTTTFIDNTPDANVTGQSLVLHRDVPANFTCLEVHKDRVWGFGYTQPYTGTFDIAANTFVTTGAEPSDLWYSNYVEPWGFDNTNQVIPVGRNAGGDVGVALATLGSLLICFKTRSTWAVYGDSQADFLPRRLFDIGCTSKKAVVKAYGIVFWLSDRGVWSFDGADAPRYLSKDIKTILDALSLADLAQATAFMRNRMYWLSLPTKGVTYGYDLDTQKWFKLGWSTGNAVYDPDNLNEVTAQLEQTSLIDTWFAAETDRTNPIASSYTSRIADSGALAATKQYRHAVIEAPVQPGAVAAVTITVDPGVNPKTYTKLVDLGVSPPRHLFSLPPNMTGFEVQVTINVTSSQKTEIQRVSVMGYIKRQLVPQG